MQTMKAERKLHSFVRNQYTGIILGISWIAILTFLVYHGRNNIFFFISIGTIALLNCYAVIAYIWHVIMIKQINIAGSITETQRQLAKVQSSFNLVGRILILQSPLYCTFWYTEALVQNGGALFWIIQLIIVSAFTVVSVYLFRTLTGKNIHKKWVKAIMESFGGKTLTKAMEFLNEIEAFEKSSP